MSKGKRKRPQQQKGLYKLNPAPGHILTEGEKEMFAIAETLAEKIHYAGMAAAIAFFEKLDYSGFKKHCRPFGDSIRQDAYDHFMGLFYEAYCNGFESGRDIADQLFEEETQEAEKRAKKNGSQAATRKPL